MDFSKVKRFLVLISNILNWVYFIVSYGNNYYLIVFRKFFFG